MGLLYKKEMYLFFSTPFGFVFLGFFLLLSGIMFTIYNLVGGNSDMTGMFDLLKNSAFLIFPILTMRSFAEERRLGTEQLLLTSRLNNVQIVLAKYFASLTVFAIGLGCTLFYMIFIRKYGQPNTGLTVAGYFGFFLLGAAMIAVCLLMACFAENQITAAVLSFGVLFLLVILASLSKSLSVPVVTPILSALAITVRYDDFTLGVLKSGSIVYYVFFSFACVFMTVKCLSRRQYL
ncbi:MAG: ABC transporter permease subunit [Eubacterium sp.]|nr:ABC transporter permease subunit [Eubacterium sp.]